MWQCVSVSATSEGGQQFFRSFRSFLILDLRFFISSSNYYYYFVITIIMITSKINKAQKSVLHQVMLQVVDGYSILTVEQVMVNVVFSSGDF